LKVNDFPVVSVKVVDLTVTTANVVLNNSHPARGTDENVIHLSRQITRKWFQK